MADIKPALTNLRGPAARITSVVAETLPSGEPAFVEMSGPDQNRQFVFGVPAGIPGVNAIPTAEAMSDYATSPASPFYGALQELTQSRTGVVSAMDFGVMMDGATDDTAAWQLLVDTVPRGTTIMLPASPTGAQWSLISDTIVISTDSLRIVGPSSYMYNGGFVFEGVNKPMFVVKAAGVQFDYFSVIGRSKFGADPTYGHQVGVEFFGSVAGNVDARMSHCSFISLGTAIITRGRNLTLEQSLFGESATAWKQFAKDPNYHDMGEPNIIRGNIARNNRFHAIGTSSDAVIRISDHTDYRHGSISDNYFDNNCMGTAVVAVGSEGAPIRGLEVSRNRIVEQTAGGFWLQYLDSPVIHDNQMLGTGSALYDFHGIRLLDCEGPSLDGNVLSRIGGHGLWVQSCSFPTILNTRMSLIGTGSSGANGITFNPTTVGARVSGLVIEGATGYGISGDPERSALDSVKIRATLGPIYSGTLEMPATAISGAQLSVTVGSPEVGIVQNYPVLLLDPNTAEGAGGFLVPPDGADLVAVELVMVTTTAASGSVVMQMSRMIPNTGMGDGVADTSPGIVVPATANTVFRATAHLTTPAQLGLIGVRTIRIANHASDTYPHDIGILAIRLVQTQ